MTVNLYKHFLSYRLSYYIIDKCLCLSSVAKVRLFSCISKYFTITQVSDLELAIKFIA